MSRIEIFTKFLGEHRLLLISLFFVIAGATFILLDLDARITAIMSLAGSIGGSGLIVCLDRYLLFLKINKTALDYVGTYKTEKKSTSALTVKKTPSEIYLKHIGPINQDTGDPCWIWEGDVVMTSSNQGTLNYTHTLSTDGEQNPNGIKFISFWRDKENGLRKISAIQSPSHLFKGVPAIEYFIEDTSS